MSFKVNLAKKKIEESKILFFDLDGTLIDTEKLYFRFWKEAARFYGYELRDEDALSLRSTERNSGFSLFMEISDGKLNYDMVREKRIELMDEYFRNNPYEIKDGTIELLTKYKKENKRIYIVTANAVEKAERIMKTCGFFDLIDGIISAKDVKRGKPFPDVYLKACEVVGASPSEVVTFEDSPNGLLSSYRSGCFTLMVEDLTPYDESMNYVDAAVSSLRELL